MYIWERYYSSACSCAVLCVQCRESVWVKQGSRLYVSQKGPYCYRVYQTKMNITWNKNDTVSYNKFTKYVFYPGSSCSSCDPYTNNITLPNLPQVILYIFFLFFFDILILYFHLTWPWLSSLVGLITSLPHALVTGRWTTTGLESRAAEIEPTSLGPIYVFTLWHFILRRRKFGS